jgi:hypothetical protein
MRDFAQHEAHTEHEPQRARSPSAQSAGERADSKPDWMKDFE